MFVAAAGTSLCRIRGQINGSAELTDGVRFVWLEGLAHCVEAHNVRLPAEVTAAMTIAPQSVEQITIDFDGDRRFAGPEAVAYGLAEEVIGGPAGTPESGTPA